MKLNIILRLEKQTNNRCGRIDYNLISAQHIRGAQLRYADESSDRPTTTLRAWLARAQESLRDRLEGRRQTSEVLAGVGMVMRLEEIACGAEEEGRALGWAGEVERRVGTQRHVL
jgi:hypothetical protein